MEERYAERWPPARGRKNILFSWAWKQGIWLASCLMVGKRNRASSRNSSREGNKTWKYEELRIERRGILIPRRVGKHVSHFFPHPPSPSFLSPLLPRIFRRHKSRYYVARETNHYTADGLLRRKFDGRFTSQGWQFAYIVPDVPLPFL